MYRTSVEQVSKKRGDYSHAYGGWVYSIGGRALSAVSPPRMGGVFPHDISAGTQCGWFRGDFFVIELANDGVWCGVVCESPPTQRMKSISPPLVCSWAIWRREDRIMSGAVPRPTARVMGAEAEFAMS